MINEKNKNSRNFDHNSEVYNSYIEELVPVLTKLMDESHYNEAIEAINIFLNQNLKKEVQKNYLKDQLDMWKGLIFEEQKEYNKALCFYRSAYKSIQPCNELFFLNKKLGISRVLHKLGNNEEACKEIEQILDWQIYNSSIQLLASLEQYINILDNSTQDFPVKYKQLIVSLVKEFDVTLSDYNLSEFLGISQIIKEMSQKNREANRRYSLLFAQLRQENDRNQQVQLFQNYVTKEKVAYYRNLVAEQLNK